MYKNKLLQAASWWNKLFLLIIPHKYENIDIKILEVKLPKGWMKQIEQLKLLHVLLNVTYQVVLPKLNQCWSIKSGHVASSIHACSVCICCVWGECILQILQKSYETQEMIISVIRWQLEIEMIK